MCPFSSLAFLQPTTVDKEPTKKARQGLTLIETEKKSPVFPTYLVINKVRNVVFPLHTIGNSF